MEGSPIIQSQQAPSLSASADLQGSLSLESGLATEHHSAVKNLPTIQETQESQLWSLGQEDPLEEEMATHSSILAWKIPWTEQPVRLLGLETFILQKSRTYLSTGQWDVSRKQRKPPYHAFSHPELSYCGGSCSSHLVTKRKRPREGQRHCLGLSEQQLQPLASEPPVMWLTILFLWATLKRTVSLLSADITECHHIPSLRLREHTVGKAEKASSCGASLQHTGKHA